MHQPHHSPLGRAVGGEHGIAKHPARRGGEDHPAIAAPFHLRPGGLGHVPRTTDMNCEQGVEIVEAQTFKSAMTQVARIGDNRVNATEIVHRRRDDLARALGCRHGIIVGHCRAAGRADLIHHGIGETSGNFCSSARHRTTEIVHDYRAAAPRDLQGINAAKPAARACNDDDLSFERNLFHVYSPVTPHPIRAASNPRRMCGQCGNGKSRIHEYECCGTA